MNPVSKHPIADELFAPGTIERASQAALADRRQPHNALPGKLAHDPAIEIGSFRAEDHPLDEPCGS